MDEKKTKTRSTFHDHFSITKYDGTKNTLVAQLPPFHPQLLKAPLTIQFTSFYSLNKYRPTKANIYFQIVKVWTQGPL